ncbi:MAG TPA: hypothetical protein DCM87_03060 [Planctomycetes bacterium]|nr:hypothetical protein [Planctomycetota bacterium]
MPEPTYIIDSGGGFQALWRLREPIAIDGDLSRAEDAARYSKRLEMLFGADRCHNVDRLLRLPSTWNLPDEQKRKRGRERALAEVYSYRPERIYDLAQFEKAPDETPSDEPRPVEDINALPIDDRLKRIAVLGYDPDNPTKPGDNSRSGWLFDFLCNGMRQSLDDATLYSIITDPDLGISAHVRQKKRWHDYGLRQIAEARREVAKDADSDPVAWVNARYFAALEGGKVAFYREADLEAMQSSAFDFELLPKKKRLDNGKEIPYSAIWRPSDKHRYYPRGFVLDPSAPPGTGHYNLWRGFAVEPAPGSWDRIRAHIYEVLANGNEAHANYILRWTAWSIQNPHLPPRVALVFQSDREGVGKGAWCNALVDLFGPHGLRIQDMVQLTGRFNAHLRHCCLLFCDEAISPGPDGESSLKGYITEPTIPIERKGVDIVSAENHLHIVVSSNNRAVVPAGPSARRFAVFSVSDRRAGDHDYFAKLFAEINGAGLAAMLHDMLERDLGGWHPEAARPDTAALSAQKIESLGPVEAVWFDVLLEGDLPPFAVSVGGSWKVHTQGMRDYVRETKRRTDVSSNRVADLFRKLGYEQVKASRPRGYIIPHLEKARHDWDEKYFVWEWEDKEGEWHGTPL